VGPSPGIFAGRPYSADFDAALGGGAPEPGARIVVVLSLRPSRAMNTPAGLVDPNYFPTFDNLRLSTKSAAELRFRPAVLASR
jgi:hypothetical protein